jgi:Na+/H+-dicarboxylate symporter
MKVWLKLLIGAGLGIAAGHYLPFENESLWNALVWLEDFAIQIGTYTVVPLLFFTAVISFYELRQDNRLAGLVAKTILFILLGTVVIISLGIAVTLVFPPARIPILIEEQNELITLDWVAGIRELLPANAISIFTGGANFLLPLWIFSFFFALGLAYDRNYTKPVISLLDSLSRIFYQVTSIFCEILSFVMIILSAYWMVKFREALQAEVFHNLILLLGIWSGVLAFIIMPLLLYLLRPRTNPWKAVYAVIGPAIAAFFSGNVNFTLPLLYRHAKENLGIQRRSNVVTITLFTSFGRAGSAMIAAMAFIIIIKSYSSLGITSMDVVSIILRSILISLFLTRHPGGGANAALAVLCTGFGKGFQAGYLILKPVAFYLVALGTFLDVMFALYASFAVAKTSGFQEDRPLGRFV